MGKVVALILIALGAKINAEEVILVDTLLDRASNQVVGEILVDMDEATLAKPAKAASGAKTAARTTAKVKAPPARRTISGGPKRGAVPPTPGVFTPFKTAAKGPKRVFGGTNRIEGNMAGKGMPIMEDRSIPSYWGGAASDKGLGFGWTVGAKKVNSDIPKGPVRKAAAKPTGKFNAIQSRATTPKRLFGGTNRIEGNMAGKGKAIMETPAQPTYWGGKKSDKGIGYGWFNKKEGPKKR